MTRLLVVVTALAVGIPSVAPAAGLGRQAEKPPVSGKFRSKDISFPPVGAYAFRSTSSLGEAPIIDVVVSNANIGSTFFDAFLDRRQAINTYIPDGRTAAIHFEFSPSGAFNGVSYYIESGNGCGYCSGPDMKSTVKLTAGRLIGRLSYTSKDVNWDMTLDVAVASDDHGPALPGGGGEPGRTYVAYAAAVRARNAPALRRLLGERTVAAMDQADKGGDLKGFLEALAEQHDMTSVKIGKGFASADTAVLVVSGPSPQGLARAGEVVLRKEPTGWRVSVERISFAGE
jgi:hypothetical protein